MLNEVGGDNCFQADDAPLPAHSKAAATRTVLGKAIVVQCVFIVVYNCIMRGTIVFTFHYMLRCARFQSAIACNFSLS